MPWLPPVTVRPSSLTGVVTISMGAKPGGRVHNDGSDLRVNVLVPLAGSGRLFLAGAAREVSPGAGVLVFSGAEDHALVPDESAASLSAAHCKRA